MKKKGFILLIFFAAVWWWYFYSERTFSKKEILPLTSEKQKAVLETAEKKERKLEAELIKKAEDAFLLEYGRKPENLAELIDKGFLSPGIYNGYPE